MLSFMQIFAPTAVLLTDRHIHPNMHLVILTQTQLNPHLKLVVKRLVLRLAPRATKVLTDLKVPLTENLSAASAYAVTTKA